MSIGVIHLGSLEKHETGDVDFIKCCVELIMSMIQWHTLPVDYIKQTQGRIL